MENKYLLDYIGKTKSRSLQDDIAKYVIEKKKVFCKVDNFNLPMSIIDVTHPGEKEILQLGASIPSDLILDGFGQWINSWIGLPATNDFIDDSGNLLSAVKVKQTGSNLNSTECIDRGIQFETAPDEVSPCGTLFRLGSGITPPARGDFKIETLLGSAPENSFQGTGNGGWNSVLGKATVARSYPNAVGSGTINEIGAFAQVARRFSSFITMLTHDLVSPGVSYTPGQVINVNLVWQL